MMRGGKINFGWGGGADGDIGVPGGAWIGRLSFEGIGIL
jgi:hypothetical protein